MYSKLFKRMFDFIAAIVGIIMFSPIFIIVMGLLSIANWGTPFFVQKRPGRHNRIFNIVKFKTMNDKRDLSGKLLPDSQRITWLGAFVRKTSLDEMPQLLNVLMGDMSFVGPRPLLPEYLPFYTKEERKRHLVRPGITGLAQINGRNTVGWDARLAYDVRYVSNVTFRGDFEIILKTIAAILYSKGVTVDPRSTMKDLNDERRSTN